MKDNTQPEALRLADELAQRWGENMACPELDAAAELRRLHAENERLAALVEAQQPADCGNTPYDEGPFTLAQQPAPSAAGDVFDEPDEVIKLRALAATCYAGLGAECNLPENWLDALNAAANGEPFTTSGLLPYKAQPSTTPQADSQPAPVRDESAARDECKRQWLAEDEDCNLLEAYDRGWKDRAARAPADPQLRKFYGVTTDAELIAAQARHIERLQAKLQQTPSFAPQRVREG